MRRALAVVLVVMATACIQQESQSQVKDLRVLAMKLDPPELLFSFLHIVPPEQRGDIPLGPYNMTAQVLAVDPQGREVTLSTRLCPDPDAEEPCRGYRMRDTATAAQLRAVRPHLDQVTGVRRAEQNLGGELSVPSVAYTFTADAVDYMIPHTPDGDLDYQAILFPAFPYFVTKAEIPGTVESETAIKRFQVTMDLSPQGLPPEAAAQIEGLFSGQFEMEFCPPETDPRADVQCIKRRVQNRNPVLERVLYRHGGGGDGDGDGRGGGPFGGGGGGEVNTTDVTSGGTFVDFTGRVTVTSGTTVTLRPVVAEHHREPYQSFQLDTRSGRIIVKNYEEDMAYSWYTTSGSISGTTDEVRGGFGLGGQDAGPGRPVRISDASWGISADTPPGPAYVGVVVRDQRGGVDWRRLDFEVVEGPFSSGSGPLGF